MTRAAGAAVAIATPAPRGSRSGNRATALRWAMLLRQLGHRPFVGVGWSGRDAEALLAVHARKSAPAVRAFATAFPGRGIAVLLAGTDVYPTFDPDPELRDCLDRARAIVALQPEALALLPPELAAKTHVIVQSATAVAGARPANVLQVAVLAHLRPVKDPLLPFRAAALLPATLALRVELAGGALDAEIATAARNPSDPRCRWLGELDRRRAKDLVARSHLVVVPSIGEGGANVLSEAIAAGTPVLATAIPGNTGLLGTDWPGLFPVGDAAALAALLRRCACEPPFLAMLIARTAALAPLVHPARERAALAALATELLRRDAPPTATPRD